MNIGTNGHRWRSLEETLELFEGVEVVEVPVDWVSGQRHWVHFLNVKEVSNLDGDILEFGTFEGKSITELAELFPDNRVYGFDSWDGLPEAWNCGAFILHEGAFKVDGLPKVPSNVALIRGWFDETVPLWKDMFDAIKVLHVDCDLYSSTRTVLNGLNEKIKKGTIIVFDEYACFENMGGVYTGWEQHEYKACIEWQLVHDREIKPICRTDFGSVVFEVIK